jgi:hypothetical protein
MVKLKISTKIGIDGISVNFVRGIEGIEGLRGLKGLMFD